LDRILCFSEFIELNNKIVNAKTKAILAILDPSALPIAILPFPSRLDSIEINISGEDVAIPIKIKLDINPDILYFLEILSVDDTSRFAP
tara:strand:- start:437 stop:703 length:267 start_codon:yes stop_codon:yes gene_type:complete